GKTQFLANLAHDLSGFREKKKSRVAFEPNRPLFSKIIAISYSVFDNFARPPGNSDTYSYKYCGIRAPHEKEYLKQIEHGSTTGKDSTEPRFLSAAKLRRKLENALQTIIEKGRVEQWQEVLGILLKDIVEILEIDFSNLGFYRALSSGQKILV